MAKQISVRVHCMELYILPNRLHMCPKSRKNLSLLALARAFNVQASWLKDGVYSTALQLH